MWQYSKLVKCPLENQYFASYIAIAAVYFERICITLVKSDSVKKKLGILEFRGKFQGDSVVFQVCNATRVKKFNLKFVVTFEKKQPREIPNRILYCNEKRPTSTERTK